MDTQERHKGINSSKEEIQNVSNSARLILIPFDLVNYFSVTFLEIVLLMWETISVK